jgi:hypothetical protein
VIDVEPPAPAELPVATPPEPVLLPPPEPLVSDVLGPPLEFVESPQSNADTAKAKVEATSRK